MNFRDFRIGWRLLRQEPGYSSVVTLGLSIGFAVCFLLLSFVHYSLSYDARVPQADRVYLLKHRLNTIGKPAWYESTPLPYLEVAKASGLVEAGTMAMPIELPFKVGGQVQSLNLLIASPSFAQIFGIKPLNGDLASALTRPDALALTETSARKLFGSTDVVGKSLQIAGNPYTVTAVLADPPPNTTVAYAALAGSNTVAWSTEDRNVMQQSWTSIGAKIYLKLNSGASPVQLEQLLQHAADRSPLTLQLPPDVLQKLGQRKVMDLKLGALRGMYFDTDTGNTPLSGPHGDKQVVYGLAAIGILILILAGTNYVNLATVRTLQRQKEIAMRKVLGASIARVAAQFLAESLVVAMSATLVGLLFARLGLPVFATLMDRNLTGIFTVEALLITVLMGAMVGIVAGAYPAWVALQVRPQRTLAGRGNNESNSGLWSRRLLTVVQFSTAMALTGVTLAIAWQSQFASQHDPGFDTSPLLVVEMPVDLNNPAGKAYREALTRLPGVYGVAAARDPIGRSFIGSNMSLMRVDGEKASSVIRRLSSNFFDVYKLRPVAGRLFDPRIDIEDKSNVAVLNESAVRALGYKKAEEAVGQIVAASIGTSRQDLTIIGVAPDIRQESLRELPQPIIYLSSLRASVLTVGTDGDLSALESRVVTMGHQYFPNEVVDVRPAQSYFSAAYAEDNRLAKLLAYSTLVAVAIASFGIYVLATYSIQRQSKEIVVRKLFGANHADIALLVGREFVMLIAFGALIGLPIGGFTIMRYLAPFVERAPIGVWTLLAALLLSLIVTVLSTSRQTWLALHMNPSVILRD